MKIACNSASTQHPPIPDRTARNSRFWLQIACRSLAFGLFIAAMLATTLVGQGAARMPDRVKLDQSQHGRPQGAMLQSFAVESASQTPQAVAANHATRTPRPTATPPEVPPPADPTSTNFMIFFGVLIVGVILFGIWLNRRRALRGGF